MNCPIANFGKQSLVYTCLFSGGQFFGLSLSYIEELSEPGQRWGLPPPSFFCRSATLFQPRGQIMPAALQIPPPDFHTFLQPCMVHTLPTKTPPTLTRQICVPLNIALCAFFIGFFKGQPRKLICF